MLSTLVVICEIAYAGADKRAPKSVLRLFNLTFKHPVLLTQLFPKEPKIITRKKLFGIYFHSITCDLPAVSSIIAQSSLHSEMEFKRHKKYRAEASKISKLSKESKLNINVIYRKNGSHSASFKHPLPLLKKALPLFQNHQKYELKKLIKAQTQQVILSFIFTQNKSLAALD